MVPLPHPDELLAEVFAFEQGDERARRIVEPVDNRFAVLELALGNVRHERWQRVFVAVLPVENDHPLHPDAVDQHGSQPAIAVRVLRAVLGDQAAK